MSSFPTRRGHRHPDAPDLAVRPLVGALLLAGGLGSLLIAWRLTGPTSGRGTALGATTLLVAAALVAVVAGVALLVRGTECRTRRLFRARRLFVIGLALAAVAAGLAIGCLMAGPFDSVLATGRISTADTADGCMIAAAMACLTGAVVAFASAREARLRERHWLDLLRR